MRLPDLALASQMWISDEFYFDYAGVDWEQIVPADQTRWSITFIGDPIGKLQFSTKPVSFTDRGIAVNNGDIITLDYQTFGPIVGLAWFVLRVGPPSTLCFYEAKIRKTDIPSPIVES